MNARGIKRRIPPAPAARPPFPAEPAKGAWNRRKVFFGSPPWSRSDEGGAAGGFLSSRVPNPEPRTPSSQTGFTLLEILVAISIFAVVAAMAYGGLNGIVHQREAVRASMDRLKTLQQGFTILARDINQAMPRQIRDTVDAVPKPALAGATQNIPALVLTRGGWSNPLGDRRSTLQRVAYELDDNKLVRLSWLVLDRSREIKPMRQVLFDNVTAFRLRFLDATGQWRQQWPPLNKPAQQYLERLPQAVEVAVDIKDVGLITRILELP